MVVSMLEKNYYANLGYLLNKAARLIKGCLNNSLKELELTASQLAVLKDLALQEELDRGEKAITPGSIAERLQTDRPTITGILNRLEKRGLLTMEVSPKDRRFHMVLLTAKAMDLVPKLEEKSTETITKAVANLTTEEQEVLNRLLIKVIKNLS
jgi:DNA-binding MarR family transcriptional regulator